MRCSWGSEPRQGRRAKGDGNVSAAAWLAKQRRRLGEQSRGLQPTLQSAGMQGPSMLAAVPAPAADARRPLIL
jgi:hypothetical protein